MDEHKIHFAPKAIFLVYDYDALNFIILAHIFGVHYISSDVQNRKKNVLA